MGRHHLALTVGREPIPDRLRETRRLAGARACLSRLLDHKIHLSLSFAGMSVTPRSLRCPGQRCAIQSASALRRRWVPGRRIPAPVRCPAPPVAGRLAASRPLAAPRTDHPRRCDPAPGCSCAMVPPPVPAAAMCSAQIHRRIGCLAERLPPPQCGIHIHATPLVGSSVLPAALRSPSQRPTCRL